MIIKKGKRKIEIPKKNIHHSVETHNEIINLDADKDPFDTEIEEGYDNSQEKQ